MKKILFIIIMLAFPVLLFSITNPAVKLKITKAYYKPGNKSVYVIFSVLSGKNIIVRKISKHDISAELNGNPVDFSLTGLNKQTSISLLLLVDASGSINEKTLLKIEKKVGVILSGMNRGDEVSLFSFNDFPMRLQNLTRDKKQLMRAIFRIGRAGKLSRLYNAIYRGVKYLQRKSSNKKKAIVIFSDGKEEGSTIDINAAIGIARKYNIPIYSIGYSNINKKYFKILKTISVKTGGKFSYEGRSRLVSRLLSNKNNEYSIKIKPDSLNKENTVKLNLRVNNTYASVNFNVDTSNITLKARTTALNINKKKSAARIKKSDLLDSKIKFWIIALILVFVSIIIVVLVLIKRTRKNKLNKADIKRVIDNEMQMVKIMEKEKDYEKSAACSRTFSNNKMDIKSVDVEVIKSTSIMEVDIEVELDKITSVNKTQIEVNESEPVSIK